MKNRGYFGLALYHPKNSSNWGSLVRTAKILKCSFIAAIGARFPIQSSDTQKAYKHLPIFQFKTFEEFEKFLPEKSSLVGVELNDKAVQLKNFCHPERAVYLLGAEDTGIPIEVLNKCNTIVKLEGDHSMNVAVAGSIVLYHRMAL